MVKPSVGILHYSLPPVVGGVEAVIRAQAAEFLRAGYPLRLIGGRGEAQALPEGAEFARIDLLDSQHAEILAASAELEAGRVPAEYAGLVERIHAALRPVVLDLDHLIVHNVFTKHFNLPLTEALFRLVEDGSIRRCIAWGHDFSWTSPNSRKKVYPGHPWDLLRSMHDAIDYAAVSKERREMLAGLYECDPERIRVIYNGVDWRTLLGISPEGAGLIERLGMMEAGLALLMPVRLIRVKNVEYAIRVVGCLKDQDQQPRLVLTGPPDPHDPDSLDYLEKMRRLRAELGLVDELRFVYESGPASGPEAGYTISEQVVGDLYRVCDLVFMPSHREGFGMPVLEAGLAGLPVIATRFPAAVEIGAPDLALFDLDQPPEETARLIRERIEASPISRMRQRVRREFTWQAIFRREIEPIIERSV